MPMVLKKLISWVRGVPISSSNGDGAVVVNLSSTGFVTFVISDVALALCSDEVASVSA